MDLIKFLRTRLCRFHLAKQYCHFRHLRTSNCRFQIDKRFDEYNEREFQPLTVNDFKTLATTEDVKQKVEQILLSYENLKFYSHQVPSTLTMENMKELLLINGHRKRTEYLRTLFKKELREIQSRLEKEEQKKQKQMELGEKWATHSGRATGIFDDRGNVVYGLWHNSLFTRINQSSHRKLSATRLRKAALFGPKLVIDLSFEEFISRKEAKFLTTQMNMVYTNNRYKYTANPFHLHFCNLNPDGVFNQFIEKTMPVTKSTTFLAEATQKSFTELFKQHKIAYLTPNAKRSISEFDPDIVYVIPALSELTMKKDKFEMNREESDNFKFVKIPINQHVVLARGKISFGINTFTDILNSLKDGNDMRNAVVENVSQRIIKSREEIEEEDEFRGKKLKRKLSLYTLNKEL